MNGASLALTTDGVSGTEVVAARLAAGLHPGDLIALDGPLGAGKTAFVRGLASGLGVDPRVVKSPTFVLHHVYGAPPRLHHLEAAHPVEGEAERVGHAQTDRDARPEPGVGAGAGHHHDGLQTGDTELHQGAVQPRQGGASAAGPGGLQLAATAGAHHHQAVPGGGVDGEDAHRGDRAAGVTVAGLGRRPPSREHGAGVTCPPPRRARRPPAEAGHRRDLAPR